MRFMIKKFYKKEINKILLTLKNDGIVLIDNLKSKNDIIRLSKKIGRIYFHPHSNHNGITYINNKGIDNRRVDSGFKNNKLLLHTDRGITEGGKPPKYLILYCRTQSRKGGENILSDGYKFIKSIKKYKYLYNYLRNNNKLIYNNGIEIYKKSIIKKIKQNYILRIYLDKRVVKNSLFYKNIKLISHILYSHSVKIKLKKNQAIILNNWRWIHGRDSFYGNREILRILIK